MLTTSSHYSLIHPSNRYLLSTWHHSRCWGNSRKQNRQKFQSLYCSQRSQPIIIEVKNPKYSSGQLRPNKGLQRSAENLWKRLLFNKKRCPKRATSLTVFRYHWVICWIFEQHQPSSNLEGDISTHWGCQNRKTERAWVLKHIPEQQNKPPTYILRTPYYVSTINAYYSSQF